MKALLSFLRRRTGFLRAFAFTAFLALFVFGPLTEHTTNEKIFAAALVLTALVMMLFASARIAFSLFVVTLFFGEIGRAHV